ncbi:hypothetical protein A3D12_03780 [Candidatus Peribacteria bacterium RIFCSPHIGHO2_02_FULL_55_24]|nr:MAG: hypothetical protein A3D12_03780 [Candidatus Peribacteria bacterium RIFCSPHIGHO2_02_FULL_55_24]
MTVVGCAQKQPGIVYDAAAVSRILGLPCESSDPVPQAEAGEIIIYYGGWDLKTLCLSPGGKKRMWQDQDDWYGKYEWKAESGYYRLLLPVPNSNRRTWDEQLRHLARIDTAWKPAPVCVAATALLIHLTETGNDLLEDNWCRSARKCSRVASTPSSASAGVACASAATGNDLPFDCVFLGAALKVP